MAWLLQLRPLLIRLWLLRALLPGPAVPALWAFVCADDDKDDDDDDDDEDMDVDVHMSVDEHVDEDEGRVVDDDGGTHDATDDTTEDVT